MQTIIELINRLMNNPLFIFAVGISLLVLFFWYFATELERRKRNVGTVLMIGVTAISLMALYPPSERLKGAIDIAGGSSFTLRVQQREVEKLGADGKVEGVEKQSVTQQQVEKAKEVIEKRLNGLGTSEPLIVSQGEDQIVVQMPGVGAEAAKQIRTQLEKVAKLEFREVHKQSDERDASGKTLAERVFEKTERVIGYSAFEHVSKNSEGVEFKSKVLLSRRVALDGSDIKVAVPSPVQFDAVDIELNSAGADKMIALTQNMQPGRDRIAVVLDGVVLNAPTVQSVPLGSRFVINGLREANEAKELSAALMNPLQNPLVVEMEDSVSPTLGKAVVQQGITAGLISLLLVAVFVLLYYRLGGMVALIGLALNGLILFGVMAMFGFTFSLPGIAGMILTIGMAVDCNVLIYERLREELSAGKSLKHAIETSYDKAFTAIFDANVTSLITAIILFIFGSSAIKGFSITLAIGIVASMFSAILVTRVLFRWSLDLSLFKTLKFLDLIKAPHVNFLGYTKVCTMGSVIFIVISVAVMAIKGSDCMGIDFTGGTLIKFQVGKATGIEHTEVDAKLEEIKSTLTRAASSQENSNMVTGALLTVRCDKADADRVEQYLRDKIPALGALKEGEVKVGESKYQIQSSKVEISPMIGDSFLKSAGIALVLGLIGILIYLTIRFEFSFALGGFIAVLHDVVISIGVIVLSGNELSLIHVGAILTIAGYSINDTIVVFDRIRETLLQRTDSITVIINDAINATLSRTVLTSATTIVTVSILSFFGGSALRDFSVMILAGLVVGTYSSVFVASPVVIWWSRIKGKDIRDDVRSTIEREEARMQAP